MTDEQTAEAANDEQAVMATADNATSDDATIADAAEIEQPNSLMMNYQLMQMTKHDLSYW